MKFTINHDLLAQARIALSTRPNLYWVVGGAGSGKTTICQALSAKFDLQIYDMDAHIYGAYHGRFSQARHPINNAWSSTPNGLAWLLAMTWDEFDNFNRAALPEYLDLLVEDLETVAPKHSLLIDGGIFHPALLTQVLAPRQIVGLTFPEQGSAEIWQQNGDRQAIKEAIYQLQEPEHAWKKFLNFDKRITHTILMECQAHDISLCSRDETNTVAAFAEMVARALGIRSGSNGID